MQLKEIAEGLLWPVWRGIPTAYKKKYARTVWEQFENQIRSSAYTNSLARFIENLSARLNVEWTNAADAASVARFVQLEPAEAQRVLRLLRSEATAAVLLLRIRNEARKAEEQDGKERDN
jgi:hypothetical protein